MTLKNEYFTVGAYIRFNDMKADLKLFFRILVEVLVCSNQHQVLSRQDSSNLGSPSSQDIVRVKSDTQFVAKDVYLAPGQNVIGLAFRTNQWGSYEMRQLVMEWDHLGLVEDLENSIHHNTRVNIIQEKCRLSFEV